MIKKLLKESDDPHMALLTYRTTPFPRCGRSPAELLMGRQLWANLPLAKEQLCPQWPYLEGFKQQNKEFKSKQNRDYNHRQESVHFHLFLTTRKCGILPGTNPLQDE